MLSFKTFFNDNKISYDSMKPIQLQEVIEFVKEESEFNIISKTTLEQYIKDSINIPRCVIAKNGKKIVGAILVDQDEHRDKKTFREISILRVHPDFRGQGIAETLLRKVESSAMNTGVDIIIVQVYKQLKTHSFWKKYGYQLFNIYHEGGTEVYMYRKKL